jgi:hypothetical protein
MSPCYFQSLMLPDFSMSLKKQSPEWSPEVNYLSLRLAEAGALNCKHFTILLCAIASTMVSAWSWCLLLQEKTNATL